MTIQQRSGRVSPVPPAQKNTPSRSAQSSSGASFADHLEAAEKPSREIQLSAHARQRLSQRGISMNATERQALAEAVQQLDAKGARDAAVMRDDAAFVVNVPNRTVVTALDQSEMQQRVFTKIDSAMML